MINGLAKQFSAAVRLIDKPDSLNIGAPPGAVMSVDSNVPDFVGWAGSVGSIPHSAKHGTVPPVTNTKTCLS